MSRFWKTFGLPGEGGKAAVHLDGIADSTTLCGVDTAGDSLVHEKDPEPLKGRHRITCSDCQRIISIVRAYWKDYD